MSRRQFELPTVEHIGAGRWRVRWGRQAPFECDTRSFEAMLQQSLSSEQRNELFDRLLGGASDGRR